MTVGARSLEALIGAGLGAGVGTGAGAYMWEPKKLREWSDEYGRIYSRPLTEDEKSKRRQYIARAALIGALGGAGTSMGASLARRKYHNVLERRAAPEVEDRFLSPLRKVVADIKERGGRVAQRGRRGGPRAEEPRRVALAQRILQEQEEQSKKLLRAASKERAGRVYGGTLTGRRGHKDTGHRQVAAYSPRTHEGQWAKHVQRLGRKHGLPVYNTRNDQDFWSQYINQMFEKRSSVFREAFELELATLLEAA